MGYRSRLGRVRKDERADFLGKGYEECQQILNDKYPEQDYVSLYYPPFHEQYIELGKYCQFQITPEHFYTGFDIQKECETEFHLMTKDMLKQIIREYHQNIQENYDQLVRVLEDPDSLEPWEQREADPLEFLKRRAREWNLEYCEQFLEAKHPFEHYPYHLDKPVDKRDGFIAQSWQYEYQIFNLTYIYSTHDWEKDYLIYSAW